MDRSKLIVFIIFGIGLVIIVVAAISKATALLTGASLSLYFWMSFVWAWAIVSGRAISFLGGLVSYILLNLNSIVQFANIYRETGLLDSANQLTKGKWDTLYFSVLSWTGASYGDFMPTPEAKPWVIGETVAGYISLAILVSLIVIVFEKGKIKPVQKSKRRPKSWGRYYLANRRRKASSTES